MALLIMFVWLFLAGKIVPGNIYDREVADRTKATEIAEKAVDGLTSLTAQQSETNKLLEGFMAGSHRRQP